MSEVDALFRLLTDAPPRSAEVVKRVSLAGMDLAALAALHGIDLPRAQILLFRSLLDVSSGGKARVPDAREPAEVTAMLEGGAATGEGAAARRLWDQLATHREELRARLAKSAAEYAASPDRDRDELYRRIAIVVVLALTAFFYWREANKPLPPHQKRPVIAPVTPP